MSFAARKWISAQSAAPPALPPSSLPGQAQAVHKGQQFQKRRLVFLPAAQQRQLAEVEHAVIILEGTEQVRPLFKGVEIGKLPLARGIPVDERRALRERAPHMMEKSLCGVHVVDPLVFLAVRRDAVDHGEDMRLRFLVAVRARVAVHAFRHVQGGERFGVHIVLMVCVRIVHAHAVVHGRAGVHQVFFQPSRRVGVVRCTEYGRAPCAAVRMQAIIQLRTAVYDTQKAVLFGGKHCDMRLRPDLFRVGQGKRVVRQPDEKAAFARLPHRRAKLARRGVIVADKGDIICLVPAGDPAHNGGKGIRQRDARERNVVCENVPLFLLRIAENAETQRVFRIFPCGKGL